MDYHTCNWAPAYKNALPVDTMIPIYRAVNFVTVSVSIVMVQKITALSAVSETTCSCMTETVWNNALTGLSTIQEQMFAPPVKKNVKRASIILTPAHLVIREVLGLICLIVIAYLSANLT